MRDASPIFSTHDEPGSLGYYLCATLNRLIAQSLEFLYLFNPLELFPYDMHGVTKAIFEGLWIAQILFNSLHECCGRLCNQQCTPQFVIQKLQGHRRSDHICATGNSLNYFITKAS